MCVDDTDDSTEGDLDPIVPPVSLELPMDVCLADERPDDIAFDFLSILVVAGMTRDAMWENLDVEFALLGGFIAVAVRELPPFVVATDWIGLVLLLLLFWRAAFWCSLLSLVVDVGMPLCPRLEIRDAGGTTLVAGVLKTEFRTT